MLENITMTDIANRYTAQQLLRQATKDAYRSRARLFDQDHQYRSITQMTLQDFIVWRDKVITRASASAWNNYFRHLNILCKFALAQGWLTDNYLAHLKSARVCGKPPKTVELHDLERLIRYVDDDDLLKPGWFVALMIRLLYRTGMRRRQLAELKWSDILWSKNAVLLRAQSSKNYREWEVPFDDAQDLCNSLRYLRREIKARSGLAPTPDSRVFQIQWFNPRYVGMQNDELGLTTNQISGLFQRLKRRSGITISAHRLRHTMATQIGSLPEPPLGLLKKTLGHTQLSTTMIYVNPNLESLRQIQRVLPTI